MDRMRSWPVRMRAEQPLRIRKARLGLACTDLRQRAVIAQVRVVRRAFEQEKKKPLGFRQAAGIQVREGELALVALVLRESAYCLKTAEPLTNCPVFVVSL